MIYNGPSSLDAAASDSMKDVVRLLIYAAGSVGIIYILVVLGRQESVSGYTLLPLAVLLVVVVPVAIGIAAARRERMRREAAHNERRRDAGTP
jgi:ABC-type proline/glycine betaine transport system permease subunit